MVLISLQPLHHPLCCFFTFCDGLGQLGIGLLGSDCEFLEAEEDMRKIVRCICQDCWSYEILTHLIDWFFRFRRIILPWLHWDDTWDRFPSSDSLPWTSSGSSSTGAYLGSFSISSSETRIVVGGLFLKREHLHTQGQPTD